MNLDELNEQIQHVAGKVQQKRNLESQLQQTKNALGLERARTTILEASLMKERRDVEKLEGNPILRTLRRLFTKDEFDLMEERQEFLATSLKRDQSAAMQKGLLEDIAAIERQILSFDNVEAEQKGLLQKKQLLVSTMDGLAARRLGEIALRLGVLIEQEREFSEALGCGKNVIGLLQETMITLGKAEDWNSLDLFERSSISAGFKHSHLGAANVLIHQIQIQLQRFRREVLDVNQIEANLDFPIDDLLVFADFFYDNLVIDLVIQKKIVDAIDQAKECQKKVGTTLKAVETEWQAIQGEIYRLKAERDQIVASA